MSRPRSSDEHLKLILEHYYDPPTFQPATPTSQQPISNHLRGAAEGSEAREPPRIRARYAPRIQARYALIQAR
jgi:hypothetical protein